MAQPEEQDEPYYVMYDADFGLSGLAGRAGGELLPLPEGEVEGDEQLGEDARSLLESDLTDEVIRTLWLAADRGRFDPTARGTTIRSWLRAWSEAYPPPAPKRPRAATKYVSVIKPPNGPRAPAKGAMRDAVLAEIGAVEADLVRAVPVPGTVAALRSAVVEADEELGFRLLLRILKAHSVTVAKGRYDRFVELSDPFGYPFAVIRDDLRVDWPPIDITRRDSSWNFGFSELVSRFSGEWFEYTAREVVRDTARYDDVLQPPGTAAAVLLADVTRLHASELSDDALTALWLAGSDGGFRIDRYSIDVRRWLEQIADVCRERLRDVAPDHHPAPAPVRADLADEVLRELREIAPELVTREVQPHWHPIPGAVVARALEQVVTQVDPDLGFRMFLRALVALGMFLTRARLARYKALGERFGYGEFHVTEVDHRVQSDE
ncbi:hypothetical protein [Streptomyces lanatus]|uniref:Uncharacterized protein n=1 Tax=Streptomyces lanatus TaxID=66900 RepID=A0ABV1Y209_9ACTN|nr:hypothetical protein [Streptomyces lanatus]GHH24704.1 hypothetical protein GCM10018780_75490 [Streptomyces lanatus]